MDYKLGDRPVRAAADSAVLAPAEAHVALSLVLDVSFSMQGEPILLLNNAVNQMIHEMKNDSRLRSIVDLAIYIFGTYKRPNVYQGFKAIANCEPINLVANDSNTYVAEALNQAVDITQKRCAIYDMAGGSYKPWIVLITDGEFHDDDSALNSIGLKMKERESRGKLNFYGLGVDGYVRSQLDMLTNYPARIMGAKTANFQEFFSWIGRSMKVVSSKSVSDEETVVLRPIQFKVY